MRLVLSALAPGILALAVSCASLETLNPLPQLGFGQVSREEEEIARHLRAFTSRAEVYREFQTIFTSRALFLSREVRVAAAAWEARSRLLDPVETEALQARIVAPGEERVEFLVGFYAPDEARSRLEDPAGGWEIYLTLDDGRRLRASCLLLEPKEGAPFLRFLRWDLSWSRLYKVCFPIRPGDPAVARGMTLVIAGPEGKGEMPFPSRPAPPNPPAVSPSNP